MDDPRPVALVTGSSSGIGAGIARRLAADGMRVVVHSRASRDAGQGLANDLGGCYVQADLADEQQARRLVTEAVGVYGRLDVLVNNAGISWPIPHTDLAAATPADWRRLLEVNLIAPWVLITEALPALRRSAGPGGGSIVNITSHAGVRPKGSSIPYAASKAALNHTTRLLAAALGPDVRVNAVAPGLVDTPMTADWTDAQRLWRDRSPMRRAATPEDVADLDDRFQGSVVVGQERAFDRLACAVVVPDRGGEGQDALRDADPYSGWGVAAVSFEVELCFEGVVDGLDDLA